MRPLKTKEMRNRLRAIIESEQPKKLQNFRSVTEHWYDNCAKLEKQKGSKSYVPQHRTLKLQDTRQDREQHHETSTQTRMTERHHGNKMAPVAPPTIERIRQLIVAATVISYASHFF
ncbi:hypothetical protein AVEN_22507-1 [Araneus ventricosus]|uniref:Uncharacterized protein n=1 Tax=Araneus ventricosus TaxID=182803 RepID=A0A4Y2R7F1_ARAVE|nr:hypothetical protein AVEN_22507-1 [Araneus ventricosus]